MSNFNIVVVASRNKDYDADKTYGAVLRGFIRLIDYLHFQDKDKTEFTFLHNGVFVGPLSELFKVLNATENGLRSRGYWTRKEKRKMDIVLDGPDTEQKWVARNLKDADAIFYLNDAHIKPGVREVVKKSGIYTMEVKL